MTPRTYDLLDFFAGPGGWDEGAAALGITSLGIEIDADACATAEAAGHRRVQMDVTDMTYAQAGNWTRKIFVASPPCVNFSKLNKGHHRKHVDELVTAVLEEDFDWGEGELPTLTLLPLMMGPWVRYFTPTYVAFEQVPSVLPVWEAYAEVLERWGYWTWTGQLDAAHYGTPQHRKRAVLMASRREPVKEPFRTHGPGDWAEPFITVGEALGWTAETVRDPARINDQSGTPFDHDWPFKRPALTIAGRPLLCHPGANANRFNGKTKSRNDGFRLTEQEMAVLQGFRRDYPFRGNRSSQQKQIGNVVPVQMATAILAALTGH